MLSAANAQISLARNVDANSNMKDLQNKDKQLQMDMLKNKISYEANMAAADSAKRLEKEKQKHKLYMLA